MLLEIVYDAIHRNGMNSNTKVNNRKNNKGLSGKYALTIYFDKEKRGFLLGQSSQGQRKYWQSQTA